MSSNQASASAELMRQRTAPVKPTFTERTRLLLSEIWAYRLSYLFIAPFMLCFIAFILIPVLAAVGLSFTYFNAIEPPRFIGWTNFQNLISQDLTFLKYARRTRSSSRSSSGRAAISPLSCSRG
ncbi:hypothetical protein LJK88_05215 [Paenibacillus sp. P26]|nr:hypothetical protein LJK88_05215 [Paenibacillus sp. P26]